MNISYKPYEGKSTSTPKYGNAEEKKEVYRESSNYIKYQDKYDLAKKSDSTSLNTDEPYSRPKFSSYLERMKPLYS
jgi:hypothetical protein